jgi:hypothetical protein
MPALVIDHVQPDAVLSVFSGVARLTRHAPQGFRRHISGALSIH